MNSDNRDFRLPQQASIPIFTAIQTAWLRTFVGDVNLFNHYSSSRVAYFLRLRTNVGHKHLHHFFVGSRRTHGVSDDVSSMMRAGFVYIGRLRCFLLSSLYLETRMPVPLTQFTKMPFPVVATVSATFATLTKRTVIKSHRKCSLECSPNRPSRFQSRFRRNR